MPIRIYDIAKKLGGENKQVLAKARELGITSAKGPASSLDKVSGDYLETQLRYELAAASRRGFRGLALGNFKAFADTQNVPIRPLTLVFGANSSGKSSVLHGLLLARHAVDTGELDVTRTEIGGDSVDLGGFRQYVHRREASRRVEWSAELDVGTLRGQASRILEKHRNVKVSLSFGMPLDDHGKPFANERPWLISYELEASSRVIVRLSRRPDGTMHLDRLDPESASLLVQGVLLNYTTTGKVDEETDMAAVRKAVDDVVSTLRFTAQGLLPEGRLGEEYSVGTQHLVPIPKAKEERLEQLVGTTKLFVPRAIADVVSGVNDALRAQLGRVRYLGPLRSFPPRHLAFSDDRGRNWLAGGGFAWDVLAKDDQVRKRVNDWLGDPECLQTCYRLDVLRYIAPGERERSIIEESLGLAPDFPPENVEWVPASPGEEDRPGLTIEDPKTGETTHLIPRASLESEYIADLALRRLLTDPSVEHLDELVLRDLRTNTVVSHRDVGIGVSQVLPVLVHAFADHNQIIAIEQPEIHLHPGLQAALADSFIESALGERKNTFILETHSEHLILRILRRIRETTEGKVQSWPGIPIKPEDVSVLFVEPTAKGSVIRHLPVTPDGDFGAPWPGGFFADRLADLP